MKSGESDDNVTWQIKTKKVTNYYFSRICTESGKKCGNDWQS